MGDLVPRNSNAEFTTETNHTETPQRTGAKPEEGRRKWAARGPGAWSAADR
jgi:hypothetical protein